MKRKNTILIANVSVLVFICIFFFFTFTSTISSFFLEKHLIPEPERFTELYFENHQKLPMKIDSQKQYSFSFTIHNLEYKDMIYPYNVSIVTDDKKIVLQQNTLSLHKNQKQKISVIFATSSALPKSEIIVSLPSKGQYIDFWVNE